MTVLDRIQTIVGDYAQPQAAQDFLDQATRLVVGELPEEVLLSMAADETDDGTIGVDVTNKRIISAHKAGYAATRIRADLRARLVDAEPGEGYPVYYVLANTAFVKPGGGTVVTLTLPTLSLQSDYPTGIPYGLLDAIVARAAVLIMDSKMTKEQNDYSQTFNLPNPPVAPQSPDISYAEALAIAPTAVTIASPSTTLTYAAASAFLGVGPSPAILDMSTLVSGASINRPTAPSAPDISFEEVVSVAPLATNIAVLPSSPEYTVQLPSQITPPTSGDVDLTKKVDGSTSLVSPTAPTPPSAPVLTSIGIATPTIASSPTAPNYNEMSGIALDFTAYDLYEASEETDMMNSITGKVAAELQQRRLNVDSQWNVFQKEHQEYSKELDKKIEQARLILQEHSSEMESDLRAQVEMWNGLLQVFRSENELYLGNTNLYRAESELVIQKLNVEFQNDLAVYRAEKETDIAEFNVRVENAGNLFQANLSVYNATVGRDQAQAQVTAQEAAQTSQTHTGTAQANKAQKVQAQFEEYANSLAHFRVKLDQHSSDTQTTLAEWINQAQVDIDVWFKTRTGDLEKYGMDIQNNRGTLEKTVSELNEESSRLLRGAEITRSEAQQTASQSTEIATINAARTLEAKVADFQGELSRFSQEVAMYSANAEVVIAKQRIDTESKSAKLRMMNFDRVRIIQNYETKKAAYIRYVWPHRSYKIQQPII